MAKKMCFKMLKLYLIISFSLVDYIDSAKVQNPASFMFNEVLFIGRDNCDLKAVSLRNHSDFQTTDLVIDNPVNCSYDFSYPNTVYVSFNRTNLVKASLDGQSSIVQPADLSHPKQESYESYTAISIDFTNEKLYAIPAGSDMVIVIDVKKNYSNILLSNLDLPNYIGLDPIDEGLLFVGQLSSIFSASMDGANVKKIISKVGITQVAIDHRRKAIFWVSSGTIESSDYFGDNRRVILINENPVKSLTTVGSWLYWYEPPKLLNPNSTIWTCDALNCEKKTLQGDISTVPGENLILKSYNFTERITRSHEFAKVNPCKKAGCQHFCIIANTYKGYSCACDITFRLAPDGVSCLPALGEFLLYAQKDTIKAIYHNNNMSRTSRLIDVLYPIRVSVDTTITGMHYDFETNHIYFTDNSSIYVQKFGSKEEQIELYKYEPGINILSSDYDWMSKNIYVTLRSLDLHHRHYIDIHRFPTHKKGAGYRKNIWDLYFGNYPNFDDIVLDPKRGYFYTSHYNYEIKKMPLNFQNDTIFWKHKYWFPKRGMGLDIKENKLYWTKSGDNRIVDLDIGTGSYNILSQDCLTNPNITRVYQEWLYMSNGTNICRVNKKDGSNPEMILDSQFPRAVSSISDFKIYSREFQPRIDQHPCADRNGGCEKFCFGLSSPNGLVRTCDCEGGEFLASDGKTCRY